MREKKIEERQERQQKGKEKLKEGGSVDRTKKKEARKRTTRERRKE